MALHRHTLSGFRGDLDWIHAFEGHAGTPYWPGGASGVTLDPGFDLGYADESLFVQLYTRHMEPFQRRACMEVMGFRGEDARGALRMQEDLREIRTPFDVARRLFPFIAQTYWASIVTRFPALLHDDTPGVVQSVLLSLAINRGPGNSALTALGHPLAAYDAEAIAEVVDAMQDDHQLQGITDRRDAEADYIRDGVRRMKLQALAASLRQLTPLPPQDFEVDSLQTLAAAHTPAA